MMSRCAGLCLVVLLGAIATAPAAGQSTSRVGGGLTLGLTPNLAEGFSADQICPDRSAISLSARVTGALTRLIQLEAMIESFNGPGIDCVDGLVPPAPRSGPYTRIVDYYEARVTRPPTVLSFRIGASLHESRAIQLRPYVGIARLSGKSITTPLAGISIFRGRGEGRFLLEIEGWWYSVPKRHLEEEFFDGQLLRSTLTEHDVPAFTAVFRLGYASIGGRS